MSRLFRIGIRLNKRHFSTNIPKIQLSDLDSHSIYIEAKKLEDHEYEYPFYHIPHGEKRDKIIEYLNKYENPIYGASDFILSRAKKWGLAGGLSGYFTCILLSAGDLPLLNIVESFIIGFIGGGGLSLGIFLTYSYGGPIYAIGLISVSIATVVILKLKQHKRHLQQTKSSPISPHGGYEG